MSIDHTLQLTTAVVQLATAVVSLFTARSVLLTSKRSRAGTRKRKRRARR